MEARLRTRVRAEFQTNMREEKLGGLTVRLTGGEDGDGRGKGPLVVLLHGFGAPGTDLVDLWRRIPAPAGTRFAFPAAPFELGYDSRAWWLIDVLGLQTAVAMGRVEEICEQEPPGLAAAREKLLTMLSELSERHPPAQPLILGGFSQGAMLACDTALSSGLPLAGLILWSAMPIAGPRWRASMSSRRGLQVLQSHGRQDPLLPFSQASRLRDELTAAGADLEFVAFDGPHCITAPVLEATSSFLARCLLPAPA